MKKICLIFVLFIGIVSLPETLNAQINIKDKLKRQTNNRADNKAEQGINKGLDAVENGVKDIFKKKDKSAKQTETADSQQADEEKEPGGSVSKSKSDQIAQQSLQAYSKFDFITGEKFIFYEDFSQDAIGDFPALWFSNGSGEVVTLNNYPGNWLQITSEGCYFPERDMQTSENFTVEFDLIPGSDNFDVGFFFVVGDINDPMEGGAIPGKAGVKTTISAYTVYYSGYADGEYKLDGSKDIELKGNEKMHLSYWIQKQRLRIYINDLKVIDAPRAVPVGYKYNVMRFEMNGETKPYIANFRVAAGLPDTRNKLITEGKLVTYGIYFDVNKDVVKPESYGTLKDIAAVLNEVPDVKVKIVGHTDADGADAANMDLSKRRAASVKAELVKSFNVKGERLVTDGLGESQPVGPNDTPANKAMNRRVEFVKM